MDLLYLYNNVHTSSNHIISSLIHIKNQTNHCKLSPPLPSPTTATSKTAAITMAAITPAQTTTQLLVSNTQPCSSAITFTLPEQMLTLSMLLQNNYKIPILSATGSGPLQPLFDKKREEDNRDPPAALQPKRPAWTESHAYLRGSRTNGNNLRILSTEMNMIRASKITRSLKPRRPYLSRREDEFIWGKPSSLRISQTS